MGFVRCQFVPDNGLECETWFKVVEGEQSKLCPAHSGIIAENLAAQPEHKGAYIEIVNAQRALVHKMTLEEIDAHIAGIEKIIELERTKLLTARAVRGEKIDNLSDEEREVRRQYRVEKQKAEPKPKVPKETKKVASMKADPIGHLMAAHNLTREAAMKMLGMS